MTSLALSSEMSVLEATSLAVKLVPTPVVPSLPPPAADENSKEDITISGKINPTTDPKSHLFFISYLLIRKRERVPRLSSGLNI